MKRPSLRKLYSSTVAASGAAALLRRGQRQRVAIVTYHDISAAAFGGHMAFLSRAYHIISLSQAAAGLRDGEEMPANPLVITFDDGFQSFYGNIYPVLQLFQAPATVFLTTGYAGSQDILWFNWIDIALATGGIAIDDILPAPLRGLDRQALRRSLMAYLKAASDNERLRLAEQIKQRVHATEEELQRYRLLTWEQARAMESSGLVSVGGHTRTHPILARASLDKQRQEIAGCAADLQSELAPVVRHFAYPNGELADFDAATKEMVREAGFASAVCATRGLSSVGDDLYALRRFGLDGSFSQAEIETKLSGLWIHTGRGGT